MSDTPRTDTQISVHDEASVGGTAGYNDLVYFAREQERELTEVYARAERAEADLSAARNDVVLAQAHGARWLAELQAVKAERDEFDRHADRFAKTITRLGEWAGVARHRTAQEMGDALIAKLDAVTADREQLRAALAEARQFVADGPIKLECLPDETDRQCMNRTRREVVDAIDRALAAHKEPPKWTKEELDAAKLRAKDSAAFFLGGEEEKPNDDVVLQREGLRAGLVDAMKEPKAP